MAKGLLAQAARSRTTNRSGQAIQEVIQASDPCRGRVLLTIAVVRGCRPLLGETPMPANRAASDPDVILVGAGIMSATLATFLKELDPALTIALFETLPGAAEESSDAWNNAGTGHAALCELNYTPERGDGSIDISKALEVNVEFDLSRQLWSYLVQKGAIATPD